MNDLKLRLIRKWYTAASVIGEIFIEAKHECFSLERPDLNNAPEISCVPEGVYDISIYPSAHLKRDVLLLHNVPGRDMIEVHPANYPRQLKGCIAPGVTRGQDAVWSSDVAFEAIFEKVKEALDAGGKVTIEIMKEATA